MAEREGQHGDQARARRTSDSRGAGSRRSRTASVTRLPDPTGSPGQALPQRPALRPGVRRIWRGPDTVQLGRDQRRAVVVGDVDDAVWDVLERLDGRQTTEALIASSSLDADTVVGLLLRLDAAGLIDDAGSDARALTRLTVTRRDQLKAERDALVVRQRRPGDGARAFDRRTRAVVAVEGLGRVGATLALLLDASGVGQVRLVDDDPVDVADVSPGGHRLVDVSRGRAGALRDRMSPAPRRTPPRTVRSPRTGRPSRSVPPDERLPDLVVLTDAIALGERLRRGDELGRADVAHLAIDVTDGVGRIGPFVIPGRTSCLHCLDHARADRDPQWPVVLAQLVDLPAEVPSVVLSAQLAVAAAAEVCAWLDEQEAATLDGQLVVEPPGHQPQRRAVPRHPACGCGWGGTIAS